MYGLSSLKLRMLLLLEQHPASEPALSHTREPPKHLCGSHSPKWVQLSWGGEMAGLGDWAAGL